MKNKILIVDDDKTILEAIKILLEEEGFEVSVLNDGINLMKKIHSNIPNLILLDYRLPGKDGWEIAKLIKKRQPEIPIIMISADNNIKKIAEGKIEAFLAKPFDINILLALINRYLKN